VAHAGKDHTITAAPVAAVLNIAPIISTLLAYLKHTYA
jgi:hypothetical protein